VLGRVMTFATFASLLTVALAAVAAARSTSDVPKGFEKFAPLTPGVYQPSLFTPVARFTVSNTKWNGAQWIEHGHHVVVVSWRAHNGGWEMHSTPTSTESALSTLHRLRTERASGAVGISVRPVIAVTIGGFHGSQFDGVVTGRYHHTFVPFLGVNGSKPDNSDRIAHGRAFRTIVLDVRGKVVFFEMDSDAPTQDPIMVADATKMIRSLTFP
jgi:hypothetical protein